MNASPQLHTYIERYRHPPALRRQKCRHVRSKGQNATEREQGRHKWRPREMEAIEREGIYLEC